MENQVQDSDEIHDSMIKPVKFHFFFLIGVYRDTSKYLILILNLQRVNPRKRRDKVYIGCGAGFGGDRSIAALKLLQRVEHLNYLVLECLAERTLADRFQIMSAGGTGYDSRSKFFLFQCVHCLWFFNA